MLALCWISENSEQRKQGNDNKSKNNTGLIPFESSEKKQNNFANKKRNFLRNPRKKFPNGQEVA